MSFEAKSWRDYPNVTTPITADELNRIEEGIEYAVEEVGKKLERDLISLGTEPLDEVVISGHYLQSSNSNARDTEGYPVGRAGYLEVYGNSDPSFVLQRYSTYQVEEVYWRTAQRIDGELTWYPWERYHDARAGVDLGTRHLDDVTQGGRYSQQVASNTHGDKGYPVLRRGVLDVLASSNQYTIIHQQYVDQLNNVYRRTKYGREDWTEWVSYYNKDEIDDLFSDIAVSGHYHELEDINGLDDILESKVGFEDLDGIASAYDVALQQGFEGTIDEWFESLRGDEGPYGGTSVTDPQIASYIRSNTQTRDALDARYNTTKSVLELGLKGDGVTDDSAAFREALESLDGVSLYFPPGHYIFTENFNVPKNVHIKGAGSRETLLDWSRKEDYTNSGRTSFLMWEEGVVDRTVSIVASVEKHSSSITLSSGHGIRPGDYIRITSEEILFGEAVKAELHRVIAVNGSVLELSTSTFDSYDATQNAEVERIRFTTASIEGLKIIGKGVNPISVEDDSISGSRGDSAIHVSYVRNFQMHDVFFEHVENRCVRLDSVLGAVITNCEFIFAVPRVRLQYGVSINGASQMIVMSGCVSYNDRHMVTTSTSRSISDGYRSARGIPRVLVINGNTAHGSWQDPIDTHRGGEYISITGNSLTTEATGIKLRGTHIVCTGNNIKGKRNSLYPTTLAGIRMPQRNRDIHISDNVITSFDRGVLFHVPHEGEDTSSLTVTNNTILDCNTGIRVNSDSETPFKELRFIDNYIRVTDEGTPISILASTEDLEIRGNTLVGGNSGVRLPENEHDSVDRAVIKDNIFRGQSEHAMLLRNLSVAMITGNFSPEGVYLFEGIYNSVVMKDNIGDIEDGTTHGITTG